MINSTGMIILIIGILGIIISITLMLILHKKFKKSEKILIEKIERE